MSGVAHKFAYAKERYWLDTNGVTKYGAEPALEPSLILNFLENPTIYNHGPAITVTRADTSSTYFDKDGVLKTAAANEVRFNYDVTTGACLGLMAEYAATNLMTYSRDCTNAAWTKSNCTPLLDQVGLDATANSASSLLATAGNATALQSVTSVSAARVFTAYVKRLVGSGTISITLDGGSTYTDVTSQLIMNRWVRVKATQTLANPSVGFKITTSGDKIAVDYCQLENGTFESSPLLSVSGNGARQADVISIGSLTPWFSQSTGTMYSDAQASNGTPNGVNQYVWILDDTTANERHILFRANSTKAPTAFVADGGVTQITLNTGTWNDNAIAKYAYGYLVNDCAASFNGATVQTDTSATMPTVTNLKLGVSQASTSQWGGHIRRIVYWPTRLSNAWLVQVTT